MPYGLLLSDAALGVPSLCQVQQAEQATEPDVLNLAKSLSGLGFSV